MHQASAESKSVLTLVKTTILLALVGVMLLGVMLPGSWPARGCRRGRRTGRGGVGDVGLHGDAVSVGCSDDESGCGLAGCGGAYSGSVGYTVSHDVYGAAAKVAGWKVTVVTGNASVYAGTPNGSHSSLATLAAGQSFTLPARGAGEVVSVQSDGDFQYTLTPGTPPTQEPTEEPTPACTDPTDCDPVSWVASVWKYNGTDPDPGDWSGGVITWPSWSAFASNNRAGFDSRTVYSESGQKLYPYMGEWADGCEIEVVTGGVLIIEWERGRGKWRETFLSAGDTYTINLVGSENGAMIETPNNVEPFEVSLSNCTPQKIDKGSSD